MVNLEAITDNKIIMKTKDTGCRFNHKSTFTIALIGNPRSNRYKILCGYQWSIEDWRKIVNFYKNHEYFTIKLCQ